MVTLLQFSWTVPGASCVFRPHPMPSCPLCCRVPLTPSSVQTMNFILVHSLLWRWFCFISVFVPNVSEMGLSLVSEYPNNCSFLLGMRGRILTLLGLLVVFLILRRVFSSFPLLSSSCISCECHCTNKDHSPLSSFVLWR